MQQYVLYSHQSDFGYRLDIEVEGVKSKCTANRKHLIAKGLENNFLLTETSHIINPNTRQGGKWYRAFAKETKDTKMWGNNKANILSYNNYSVIILK